MLYICTYIVVNQNERTREHAIRRAMIRLKRLHTHKHTSFGHTECLSTSQRDAHPVDPGQIYTGAIHARLVLIVHAQ